MVLRYLDIIHLPMLYIQLGLHGRMDTVDEQCLLALAILRAITAIAPGARTIEEAVEDLRQSLNFKPLVLLPNVHPYANDGLFSARQELDRHFEAADWQCDPPRSWSRQLYFAFEQFQVFALCCSFSRLNGA